MCDAGQCHLFALDFFFQQRTVSASYYSVLITLGGGLLTGNNTGFRLENAVSMIHIFLFFNNSYCQICKLPPGAAGSVRSWCRKRTCWQRYSQAVCECPEGKRVLDCFADASDSNGLRQCLTCDGSSLSPYVHVFL